MRLSFLIPPTKPWHVEELTNQVKFYEHVLEALTLMEDIEGKTIPDRAKALPKRFHNISWPSLNSYTEYSVFNYSAKEIRKDIAKEVAELSSAVSAFASANTAGNTEPASLVSC